MSRAGAVVSGLTTQQAKPAGPSQQVQQMPNLSQQQCKLLIGSLNTRVASKFRQAKGPHNADPMPTNYSFLFLILTMKSVTVNQIFSY